MPLTCRVLLSCEVICEGVGSAVLQYTDPMMLLPPPSAKKKKGWNFIFVFFILKNNLLGMKIEVEIYLFFSTYPPNFFFLYFGHSLWHVES